MPDTDGTEFGLWPTPTSDSATERTEKYAQGGTPLPVAVKMWPTPRGVKIEGYSSDGFRPTLAMVATGLDKPFAGSLNPNWVEWLMGYPIGHTACEGWVTQSSRRLQKK
jgi:hypothetical protein